MPREEGVKKVCWRPLSWIATTHVGCVARPQDMHGTPIISLAGSQQRHPVGDDQRVPFQVSAQVAEILHFRQIVVVMATIFTNRHPHDVARSRQHSGTSLRLGNSLCDLLIPLRQQQEPHPSGNNNTTQAKGLA